MEEIKFSIRTALYAVALAVLVTLALGIINNVSHVPANGNVQHFTPEVSK